MGRGTRSAVAAAAGRWAAISWGTPSRTVTPTAGKHMEQTEITKIEGICRLARISKTSYPLHIAITVINPKIVNMRKFKPLGVTSDHS